MDNTIEICINNDFNGGKVKIDDEFLDVLMHYKGKMISVKAEPLSIHIVINETTDET